MGMTSKGGIKSIQRGTITISGTSSQTATVTAVDTTKAQLRNLGCDSVQDTAGMTIKVVLTNTTTITASRQTVTGANIVAWELTEWY